MARSTRRQFTRTAPRRKRVWMRHQSSDAGITAGTSQAHDLSTFWQLASGMTTVPVGSTVTRIRGNLAVQRTAGVSTIPDIAFGWLVAPSTMDIADMLPQVERNLDWMGYMHVFPRTDTAGFTTVYDINWESMRKFEELQSTLWFVMGTTLADTFAVKSTHSALLLLP